MQVLELCLAATGEHNERRGNITGMKLLEEAILKVKGRELGPMCYVNAAKQATAEYLMKTRTWVRVVEL